MDHVEDIRTLLDRILSNMKESSMLDNDKKYIEELIQLVNEKLDIMLEEQKSN